MSSGDDLRRAARLREALHKATDNELLDGPLIDHSFELAHALVTSSQHLESLTLLLALFRQLRGLVTLPAASHLVDHLYVILAPALLHSGWLSQLVLTSLEGSERARQLRSTDLLGAIGRFVDELPASSTGSSSAEGSTLLVPFFRGVVAAGITSRASLVALATTVPHVPTSAVPAKLLPALVRDLQLVDGAKLRSEIIVHILAGTDGEVTLTPLLPAFEPDEPSTTLVNLARYTLPLLFKRLPTSPSTLLDLLSGPTHFPAWISVASLGVASGILTISDLPLASLHAGLSHADSDVRIRAFELVTSSKDLLTADVLELVKQGMAWSDALPGGGSRSEFASAFHAFLHRLQVAESNAARSGGSDGLKASEGWHAWLLDDFVDGGLRHARRNPIMRAIQALQVLQTYLRLCGGKVGVQEKVFTRDRVQLLLACQASEFTEVRSRSRAVLEASTIPLPGFDSASSPLVQALIASAMASLNHPRKTQAEAGKAALCIAFKTTILAHADQSEAVAFVDSLVDRLEAHLLVCEVDLVRGMEENSLHGTLAAITNLLDCLNLTSISAQQAWQPLFRRLRDLVARLWQTTRRVISLAPSKSHRDGTESDTPSRADHEIARAYEVLGGEGDEVEDGEGEGMDHTGLVSGCWRATSQAGDLLAAIITLPLAQTGKTQEMWSVGDVDRAGHDFLAWLHEIRHRGTFSKIALAFARLVEAVKPLDTVSHLPQSWLEHELATITSPLLSTTRRSAALPYAVLALVSSDTPMLDLAFDRLVDLARVDNALSLDSTKVHAFNILKIVLLDAKQTKIFDRYFARAVIMALQAFASPNWNVRNVALILFSSLAHRSLAPSRGSQDIYASRQSLATRPALAAWHAKHPTVVPFLREHLESAARHHEGGGGGQHSPLFPILIILRSVRWSEAGEELAAGLRQAVEPFLGSHEWQVRNVAAQALSTLLSPKVALTRALALVEVEDPNRQHGELLLLRRIVDDGLDHAAVQGRVRVQLERGLKRAVERYEDGKNPTMHKVALETVQAYMQHTTPLDPALLSHSIGVSRKMLRDNSTGPANGLLAHTCIDLLLSQNPWSGDIYQLLTSGLDEASVVAVLERLPLLAEAIDPEVFVCVLSLAVSRRASDAVQIAAMDALSEMPKRGDLVRAVNPKCLQQCVSRLAEVARGTKCVPLKEAALPALAWATSSVLRVAGSFGSLDELGEMILNASDEDQSQPRRYCALLALQQIQDHLFTPSPSLALHQSLLRLLQDDDEEIRRGAADVVVAGLGAGRPVVQKKAVAMWWEWLATAFPERDPTWIEWVWALCLDAEGLEGDLTALARRDDTHSEALFEVEPPNLFRDPLVDAHHAASLIVRLRLPSSKEVDVAEMSRRAQESVDNATQEDSPISDAWELRRVVAQRLDILKRVVQVGGRA